MSGVRTIGVVARLGSEWKTIRQYAELRKIRYGTVKRWVNEGMPVLRAHFYGNGAPIVRLLPSLADAWVKKHHHGSIAFGRKSVVYFARRISDGAIKIGFTSDVPRRLRELRKVHGKHEIISTRPGDKPDELALHARFAAHCIDGEWFHPTAEVLQEAHATAEHEGRQGGAPVRPDDGAPSDERVRSIQREPLVPDQGRPIQGVG